jgi:hypothetical protein
MKKKQPRTIPVDQLPGACLEFKWSTSRAPDGYNICTLWHRGERLAHCTGGGYDMAGTALGDWMEAQFQSELMALAGRSKIDRYHQDTQTWERPEPKSQWQSGSQFYGLTHYHQAGQPVRVSLDGACGWESMRTILQALGWDVRFITENRHAKVYLLQPFTKGNQ